jgi:transposase
MPDPRETLRQAGDIQHRPGLAVHWPTFTGALADSGVAITMDLTITGVNVIVAAGLVAAVGDIRRFSSPQKLVSYVGLNPRVRQSGLGLAQHGRISKRGRSHARAMLVEAAWAASKAPGPLRSFFLRIRARRGHQVAAVAVARKLAVLCWHLLTKDADYQSARPALVAHKIRAMQLQAGQPDKKGNKRGAAYAYNIKELRNREIDVARHAEHAYEQFVSRWQPRGPGKRRTGAANEERRYGRAAGLTSSIPTLCHAVTRAPPQ